MSNKCTCCNNESEVLEFTGYHCITKESEMLCLDCKELLSQQLEVKPIDFDM